MLEPGAGHERSVDFGWIHFFKHQPFEEVLNYALDLLLTKASTTINEFPHLLAGSIPATRARTRVQDGSLVFAFAVIAVAVFLR